MISVNSIMQPHSMIANNLRNLFSVCAVGFSFLPDVEWFLRIAALILAIVASWYSILDHRQRRVCKECQFNKNQS